MIFSLTLEIKGMGIVNSLEKTAGNQDCRGKPQEPKLLQRPFSPTGLLPVDALLLFVGDVSQGPSCACGNTEL